LGANRIICMDALTGDRIDSLENLIALPLTKLF
jgi:hypothetical protein